MLSFQADSASVDLPSPSKRQGWWLGGVGGPQSPGSRIQALLPLPDPKQDSGLLTITCGERRLVWKEHKDESSLQTLAPRVPGVPPLDLELVPPTVYITRGACEPRTVLVPDACPHVMRRPGVWCVEDFHLHKQLYKGKASLLYSATCRLSGVPIALKLYRKNKLSNLNWYQVEREIRIHGRLAHEHIIQLYSAFEDAENVYLAQEFAAGGDLYENLKAKGGRLPEAQVAYNIIHPCTQALVYMHDLGIIHRDLKSENILLTGDGRVKLADFGLSINHREERPVTRAGTLDMMAPEVLVCPEKSRPEENKDRAVLEYGTAVDAWAVGIVAFELLIGHPPFERESRSETYEHIMYRAPVMPPGMSDGARSFVTSALVKAVSKRPTMLELSLHHWLRPQSKLVVAPTTPAGFVSPPKLSDASRVNITIDCTVGSGSKCERVSPAAGEASGSGATRKARDACVGAAEEQKPSVLQWAGTSLRTITKKLRKPSPQPSEGADFASQNGSKQRTEQQAAGSMSARSSWGRSAAKAPAMDLSATMPASTAQPPSPFSGPAAQRPGRATPRLPAGRSPSPKVQASEPAAPATSRGHSAADSRHPGLRVSHSLASLALDDMRQGGDAGDQLIRAHKPASEAPPPSPQAHLSRPWTQRGLRVNTDTGPPSPSVVTSTPSPLARRRRRIAGAMDTSSSGALAYADTPKGGQFPSGPRSARTFGRSSAHKLLGSPVKRASGEAGAAELRARHSATLGRTGNWPKLSLMHHSTLPSPQQLLSVTPRKPSSSAKEQRLSRAASAAAGTNPVARKLSLRSPSQLTAQVESRNTSR